jgi:hypothetical protein
VVSERSHQAGTAAGERVAEGDRAAVRVEQGGVGTDLREPGERHRGARLVDLEDAEVRQGDAGLLQGLPVAGIGAVSMMTGALAARTAVWTLAIGVRTSSRALSLGAADPSLICELLPTWITPSGLKAGLSLARPSTVPPRRTPSSVSATVPSSSLTGVICAANDGRDHDAHLQSPALRPGPGNIMSDI